MPHILDVLYMTQTVFSWSSSQGKRDESTNVDAAKAKADAKVPSLHLCLFLKLIILHGANVATGNIAEQFSCCLRQT